MNIPAGDRQRALKSYPDRIADLVNMYITNSCGKASLPLLKALGCRHLDISGLNVVIETPPQPGAEHEALVRNTLLLALRSYVRNQMLHIDDAFAIVNGLYSKKRWRECLKNIDDAYCLAALCASLTTADIDVDHQTGGGTETACVCLLLNDWLRPDVPFTEPPPISELSRAFFGEAWFAFAIEQAGIEFWQTPTMMYRMRPPFVPGLLPNYQHPAGVELPTLGDT